jgi:hypothetical protein
MDVATALKHAGDILRPADFPDEYLADIASRTGCRVRRSAENRGLPVPPEHADHGAWMMMKVPAVPEFGPIMPQFKEDDPPEKSRKHVHADYGAKGRARHVKGKRSRVYTLGANGSRKLVSETGHIGDDPDTVHVHGKPAKYRMMSRPHMRYTHPHLDDGAPRDLDKHTAEVEPFGHGGGPASDDARFEWLEEMHWLEQHEHLSHRPERGPSLEKRLDMHPTAAALLPRARRVFFVLEGVLKADAILSHGEGEAVFDVPSVTLWDALELETFAKRLQGKTVYIVPDSDWASNPQVSSQAFECRERLRSYGLDAHVAAPTPKCGRVCDCIDEADDHKRGVDDLLADGESPDDLLVLEREPSSAFCKWAREYGPRWRSDRAKHDIGTAWWLALHADRDDGTVKRSAEAMADHVGVDPATLHDIIVRLIDEGVIESSRPLAHTIHHRHRQFRKCSTQFEGHVHVPGRQCSRVEHVGDEHPEGDPGDDDRHKHTYTVRTQVVQARQKPSHRYQGSNPREWKGKATVVDWDRLGKDDEGPVFTVSEDLRADETLMTIREREASRSDVAV